MSIFRRRLLINQYIPSLYDDILGILLKTMEVIPYSKVSKEYTSDEVIGILVKNNDKGISFCIHPYAEQKCYFGSNDMKKPEAYSGIVSGNVSDAINDIDGETNTLLIISTGQGDNSWACKYSNSVDFSGLRGYVMSMGEAQIIEPLLTQINFLISKCNGIEITNQNYWTSTLNNINEDSNTINSAWITNLRGYRDGANVQAQMFVRPIAKYNDESIVYPGLIAAWSAAGKSNDDADRAVLRDLTGNGHDITLNGFAFSEMSGYGGFNLNFLDPLKFSKWSDRNVYTIYNNRIVITEINSPYTFFARRFLTTDSIIESWKVKVTGITNTTRKLYVHQTNDAITKFTLDINEDGIYTIPKVEGTLTSDNYSAAFLFREGDVESCNVTIELIPEYEGALVLDGVDDYISLEAFTSGFKTVFMVCIPFEALQILYDQRSTGGNPIYNFAIYTDTNFICYNARNHEVGKTYINGVLNTTIKNLINKKQLITITNTNANDNNTIMPYIGCSTSKSFMANMAIYKFIGFKEILTEEQIKAIIKKYNLLDRVDEIEVS